MGVGCGVCVLMILCVSRYFESSLVVVLVVIGLGFSLWIFGSINRVFKVDVLLEILLFCWCVVLVVGIVCSIF